MAEETTAQTPAARLPADFWRFWAGQTISQLGSSFTNFAIPLLIFKLTGSAVKLGLASASVFVPYLLFGLVIGAWVDRLDRKRVMIVTDLLRGTSIAVIPLLSILGVLSVWAIYGVGFVSSTLGIFFTAGEFAALPSMVPKEDLVTANGRLFSSYSAAGVLGPLLAGLMVAVAPIETVFLVDAATFLISAATLGAVRRSFNAPSDRPRELGKIRQDVMEGLRFVLGDPVLRNISVMIAMVNFVLITVVSQLVFFSKVRLHATDTQVGLLYAAGSVGIVIVGLLAPRVRKRWPFSKVVLGTLMVEGVLVIVLSAMRLYWVVLPLWAMTMGADQLFDINTASLRQAIVPNELLGRVISIAGVLAWSAIPVGSVIGGFVIHATHNVALVFGVIGAIEFAIAFAFSFSPLGHAEDYFPQPTGTEERPTSAEPPP